MGAKENSSSNFFKKTESTLFLVVNFFIAILKTLFNFMFFPKKFSEFIRIDSSGTVVVDNEEYEQPLTYLLFFTIVSVIYGYIATHTKYASKLLLEDEIFKPFISVLGGVWNYVNELDWPKLFIVMIPLILFTILYAGSMTISCRILKIKPNFQLNITICSYYFGTYLFLHGILFSYAMITASITGLVKIEVLFIFMLIWHLFIIILIIKNFHSFILMVKLKICDTAKSTFLLITLSTIFFILFFIPVGVLVFPFFII